MTKKIHLNHGKIALVDDEDFVFLCQFRWRYNTTGYATRTSKSISMARFIMQAKKGEYVDHINGVKLDNRKSNLRIVTNQENSWNKQPVNKTKGVSKQKTNKWRAYISKNGKQIWLGSFNTQVGAMIAYDKAAKEMYGKFALTNKMLGNY